MIKIRTGRNIELATVERLELVINETVFVLNVDKEGFLRIMKLNHELNAITVKPCVSNEIGIK